MKQNQFIVKALTTLVIAFGVQTTTFAQFGNIVNRAKWSARSKVESKINQTIDKGIDKGIDKAKDQFSGNQVKGGNGTYSYGDHSYEVKKMSVIFTNIPSDYEEFETVYKNLLGKSVPGTAAMIPMAMELYARNTEVGKRCIELLCGKHNTSTMIRSLQDKLRATSANSDDPYIQRYLPAALLKGANAKNGYTPDYPYTVETKASVNKPQEVTDGLDTFLYIMSDGWDTNQRQVEIFLEDGAELYTVYNCPSVYTQCKNIKGIFAGLK